MKTGQSVPITPSVLNWAINASGYSRDEIASKLDIDASQLSAWLQGAAMPLKTQFKKMVTVLSRPSAIFFLPKPPESHLPSVQFRHPPDISRNQLSPGELRAMRQSARLQKTISWALHELGKYPFEMDKVRVGSAVEPLAEQLRAKLAVDIKTQLGWKNEYQALREWRIAIEKLGVLVLSFSLGKTSCRGFSVWDDYAPIIALNSAWNSQARMYTLFHEMAHLLSRTNSVCVQSLGRSDDSAERWCEAFAAAVLLPWQSCEELLKEKYKWTPSNKITRLAPVSYLANKFKVSLRATALRMIEKGIADWDLYNQIPPIADDKPEGGAAEGRDRRQIKEDFYGPRTASVFIRAINENLITRTDALSYLDVTDSDLSDMEKQIGPLP